MNRENSLYSSPSKKYTPNSEIEAIISKYENYKSLAFSSNKRNPEMGFLELKKVESYQPQPSSPEKSQFRTKRISSMNVDRN